MTKDERTKEEIKLAALCGEDFILQCCGLGLSPVTVGLVMAQMGLALIYKKLSAADAFQVACSIANAVGSQMHTEEAVRESLTELALGEQIH